MKTIVVNATQLCNIIGLAVMCATNVHPDGPDAMINRVKDELKGNDIKPDEIDDVAEYVIAWANFIKD